MPENNSHKQSVPRAREFVMQISNIANTLSNIFWQMSKIETTSVYYITLFRNSILLSTGIFTVRGHVVMYFVNLYNELRVR